MVEYPDGMRSAAQGFDVGAADNLFSPFYSTSQITLASSVTGSVVISFPDTGFIYYVDVVTVSPQANVAFLGKLYANSDMIEVRCAAGHAEYRPRNNPAIFFVQGDQMILTLTNLDTSARTFLLCVTGEKVPTTVASLKAPICAWSATPVSGEPPLTVAFRDESRYSPTSWSWNFGDGSAVSAEKNPTHEYAAEGTYSPSLTVTNAIGSNTSTRSNYVTVREEEDLTALVEYDPSSKLTVASTTVTFASLPMNVDAYVYTDYGSGGVNTFTLKGKINYSAAGPGSSTAVLGVSNSLDDLKNATGVRIYVLVHRDGVGSYLLYLYAMNGSSGVAMDSMAWSVGTNYYLKLVKNSGSSIATLYVYGDAEYSVLVDTLVINSPLFVTAWRYVYAISSYNSGSSDDQAGSISNINFVVV